MKELAHWLVTCGVEHVQKKSGGVYWIPVYEELGRTKFGVCLVDLMTTNMQIRVVWRK